MEEGTTLNANAPSEYQRRLMAASWQRYREAGRWKLFLWGCDLTLFVVGVALWELTGTVAELATAAAVFIVAKRLVVDPERTRAHAEAVRLQEQCEVDMFGLPWNQGLAGRPISPADAYEIAQRFRGDMRRLDTWYVPVDGLAPRSGVLLRQWENASWAARDHRRFWRLVSSVFLLSLVSTLVAAALRHASLAEYLVGLVLPSMPWLLDLADLAAANRRASLSRAEIEATAQQLLYSASNTEPDIRTLREIQDALYRSRSEVGHVPDWFYRLFRKRNQRLYLDVVQHLRDTPRSASA
jgi:hypothetical protein